MPDSRSERIFFLAGLAAIIALLFALILAYANYTHSRSAAAASPGQVSEGTAEPTSYRPPKANRPSSPAKAPAGRKYALTATASSQTRAAIKPASSATGASTSKLAKLSLAAAHGDCWVEVRASSATGKILYVATVAKGKTIKFTASKLWIRFGAPQNVQLVLNGKPVVIPAGTLNVLVSPSGIKTAA